MLFLFKFVSLTCYFFPYIFVHFFLILLISHSSQLSFIFFIFCHLSLLWYLNIIYSFSWFVLVLIKYYTQNGGAVLITGAAASGIFTRCIFKLNTAGVSEDAIIYNISLSIFNVLIMFFLHIKNHGVQNHPQKKQNIKWDSFVYGCPSLFNLFHFFDIFINIFFDAITDHHCFFFFSLFFLSHGNHCLLSYKSSHTVLTYTFIYIQFFGLFLWSLFHLWTVWWCSVHHSRFWYI